MRISRKKVENHMNDRLIFNLPPGSTWVSRNVWAVPFDGERVTLTIEHGGPVLDEDDSIPTMVVRLDGVLLGFYSTAVEVGDAVRETFDFWREPF